MVTGGSRGLGREMALALAETGAYVAITGSKPSRALDDACAELETRTKALAIVADAADAAATNRAVEAVVAAFGRIDVLINNAGLGMRLVSETFNTRPTRFWEADIDAWSRIVETNIHGPFLAARAVVPQMLTRRFGKIINISTSDGTMIRNGYSPYGPTKAFLEAASRAWAVELADTGVDVNVLLPGGATDTDLLPSSPNKRGADGNLLSPAIMRAPIRWLASDASNGITGGRFIARHWPDDCEAPGPARVDTGQKPEIM